MVNKTSLLRDDEKYNAKLAHYDEVIKEYERVRGEYVSEWNPDNVTPVNSEDGK